MKDLLPSQSELDCRIDYKFERQSVDTLLAKHEKQLEREKEKKADHKPTPLQKEYDRALAYAKDCKDSGEQWWVHQYATQLADALGIKPKVIRHHIKPKLDKFYQFPKELGVIEIRRDA